MINDKFVDGAEYGSNLYSNFTVVGITGYGIFSRKWFKLKTDLNLLAHLVSQSANYKTI